MGAESLLVLILSGRGAIPAAGAAACSCFFAGLFIFRGLAPVWREWLFHRHSNGAEFVINIIKGTLFHRQRGFLSIIKLGTTANPDPFVRALLRSGMQMPGPLLLPEDAFQQSLVPFGADSSCAW